MKRISLLYGTYCQNVVKLNSIVLFAIRIVLAYGFYGPAKSKIFNISDIISWFKEMGFIVPTLSAYSSAYLEGIGVILIALGLGTRIITIPLIFIMLVAIKTVHWNNGFDASNNGFEIPIYYLLLLFTLLTFGSGKISIDHLISRNKK